MAENQPYHIQTFSSGANYDGNIELSFAQPATGIYVDARNAEPNTNSHSGALTKINGEVLLYDGNNSGYKCTGSEKVNQYLVEFWAPSNPSFPGIVKVNGVVVLSSTAFPLRQNYPLKWDKNKSAEFSEIYVTDDQPGNPPYIFDIKDMVDSVSTQKYFLGFDPTLYQVNLQSPLDTIVFIELTNVGGGGGLPVGHYQYQMRYSNEEGDRTQWSHPTPMIPIMQSLSEQSDQYPWTKTYGGPPNPSSKTSFAPRLRFRVTNLYGYDYIEVKRIPYNSGAGKDFTPNGTIVARIDIAPGEISVRDYIDPAESNTEIELSNEAETQELAHVDHCKDLRYFDRRLTLMNVTLASREANLTFKEISGNQGFPVIDKIGKGGHNDPWNHVNRRSEMRGEAAGFGISLYDGVGNKGFTTKIPGLKNYQFPNRRDPVTADTLKYSYRGVVKASDSNTNSVSFTHEVFDHYDAVSKTNYCDFKNIIERGRVFGGTGTKKTAPYGVKQDCDETNSEIENHNANVDTGGNVSTAYQPYTPVKANDPDITGHNYRSNTKVAKGNVKPINIIPTDPIIENDKVHIYSPGVFAPDYYAMGLMVAGVQNFPPWAKSFSVVRTKSANRVLCQGLGYYNLTKADYKLIGNSTLGGKEKNKLWFYAPDIENGVVSSDTINDLIDNPQNYKLQFVSPLGFASEWYSAEDSLFADQRDRCIDMISYVRVLRDLRTNANQQINPFEDENMGVNGGDGYNYVGYDKYRNISVSPNFFTGNPAKGNRIVDLRGAKRVANGRGTYIEIETQDDFYATTGTGGNSGSHFEDTGLKNFHEPVYVINIIRTGAQINDKDIQKYHQTNHYQKLESIIGKSTGEANQRFILVDERWEDCIPSLNPTYFDANNDCYVYIKSPENVIEKWQNITFKSAVDKNIILLNIAAGVTDVKGVYTHTNTNQRTFEIVFDQPGFTPPEGHLILVRYDDRFPIRVYGGDSYISEAIFAPIDGQSGATDKAAETQFALGIGMPYKDFKINPRHYTIRKAGASINAIQDREWFTTGYIRQLCVMFTVETRSGLHLAHNLESPKQYFPLIHYVIRPNRWDRGLGYVNNHVFSDYNDDYGNDEINQWKWGGFRFLPQINPDYSVMPRIAFFSKPEFGFEEIRDFKTRVMWGLPRGINVQNAPGLKTFPANNSFDIDDNMGEIKDAWSATSDKGENLYAITESGVCLLLTKKSILSDITGGELALTAVDGFVRGQYWLTKEIGMTDEMWRGSAEASVSVRGENNSETKIDALFFANKLSVFRLMNNNVVDIGIMDYQERLLPYLDGVSPGYGSHLTAIFDRGKQQYYLHVDNGGGNKNTLVFSQRENRWIGTNDFAFESFTSSNNETYGHRNFKTFKLNEGYIINGQPIEFEVIGAASPDQAWEKEFMRIRVNSLQKPIDVQFFKEKNGVIQCSLNSTLSPLYLKNYGGWAQWIPRIIDSVNSDRPRLQGRVVVYKIIHNLASEFTLVDVGVQYKNLKLV